MSGKLSGSDIISQMSERICKHLARKVIADLQCMNDSLLSGDDSGLQNTWDEICVQVQHEESFSWQAYDDTVRALVDALIAALLPFERQAVWLQTPEGVDWGFEEAEDRLSYPVENDDITNFILRDYVYAAAANWSNQRIRGYLELGSD